MHRDALRGGAVFCCPGLPVGSSLSSGGRARGGRYGDGVRFRERVRVPPGWWALALLFAVTLGVALGYYLGPGWALGVGLGSLAAVALGFRSAAYVTEVDETEVRVGRAVIGREWIEAARPLDAAATRTRAGVDADARAHLVLRPWASTTVELTLADPADPVPYWLVSTRRPGALAVALGWVPPEPKAPARPVAPAPEAGRG